jgi:hypothetical protein
MDESPPGAEDDGELPLRAEGLGLVSLSSVDGTAGSSLGDTDGGTSEAAVVAIEGFVLSASRRSSLNAWYLCLLRRPSATFYIVKVLCRDGDVKAAKAPALGVARALWEDAR